MLLLHSAQEASAQYEIHSQQSAHDVDIARHFRTLCLGGSGLGQRTGVGNFGFWALDVSAETEISLAARIVF